MGRKEKETVKIEDRPNALFCKDNHWESYFPFCLPVLTATLLRQGFVGTLGLVNKLPSLIARRVTV